jgi:hypothetical protein
MTDMPQMIALYNGMGGGRRHRRDRTVTAVQGLHRNDPARLHQPSARILAVLGGA